MKHTFHAGWNRRDVLSLIAALPLQVKNEEPPAEPGDYTCPMDADVHSDKPGQCPRCGMTLVLKVLDRVEYPLILTVSPRAPHPGEEATLKLEVFNPPGKRVEKFEIVHEKLIHLFVVSEDLEFFAHVHPVALPDGTFELKIRLPKPGMYRLLADYYPASATPQLAVNTLYFTGQSNPAHLVPSLSPQKAANLTSRLRLEPEALLSGLQARLYYSLEPQNGLEKYLGAWGHMLIVSEDLIDLIHTHPFLASETSIQYNAIFPRPGKYKVWSQFQRLGVVNTVVNSINVLPV